MLHLADTAGESKAQKAAVGRVLCILDHKDRIHHFNTQFLRALHIPDRPARKVLRT
jgi:hypothetical protein